MNNHEQVVWIQERFFLNHQIKQIVFVRFTQSFSCETYIGAPTSDDVFGFTEDEVLKYSIPTPKGTPRDLVPSTIAVIRTIQGQASAELLKVLFDSGGTKTFINSKCLPRGATPSLLKNPLHGITAAGRLTANRVVLLKDIVLPEFSRSKKIDEQWAYVFDSDSHYDIVFGRDFLLNIGLDTCFSTKTTKWMDKEISMKSSRFWDDSHAMYLALLVDDDKNGKSLEDSIDCDCFDNMMDAKYEKVDPVKVAESQSHLSLSQQKDLAILLSKYDTLFDGTLGRYPHKKLHLQLQEGAVPVHHKAFPVAHAHVEVFKKELAHLVKIGVLEQIGATEWAAPTFIVPKKDGRVRWVSDFRTLNSMLRRKEYPLPIIQDILRRRPGYKFFTKIDLTMCYYTYELDEESADLCVIVTPFGKYRYLCLPMGIKQSPDFAQEIIEEVLRGLDECEVYIDDVGTFNNDWESHLKSLELVLSRLEANGFKVNPLKCKWAVQETDWLGYWLTPTGLKPWQKKVNAILRMGAPTNVTQTRSFLGAVTYYRDMWPKRSHVLTPLTELTGKGKFVWEPKHQHAFEQMKAIIASDAMLQYPNHNLPFEIYTNASDYQLGAVIMQNKKPVAYYSRKLTPAQKNYTTIEKELLSIVATLKEFHTMLFGANITVYTDHKNLTFHNLTSQRVIRWRNFVEEYSPTIVYIEGPTNVLADAFSRLPRLSSTNGEDSPSDMDDIGPIGPSSLVESHFHSIHFDDDGLLDCFLNHPPLEEMAFPLHYVLLQQHQFEDLQLQALLQQRPLEYQVMEMSAGVLLICQIRPDKPWRIALPTTMVDNVIRWYHLVLGHPGIVRLYQTISTHFIHPYLKVRIESVIKSCDTCQRSKLPGAGYGELPPREATLVPWYEVAVDLIGPWTMLVHGQEIEFSALTCIDTVSNLVELVRIENKTAAHIGMLFENTWVSRYPKPERCVHDNGNEFLGADFQRILVVNGIADVPTTVKNPQSNAICERMHQTAGNIIRTLTHSNPPQNMAQATQIIDSALATTMHALRCSMHHALHMSPGAFVFRRDMFLNIPLIANLQTIQDRRQLLIDENLR